MDAVSCTDESNLIISSVSCSDIQKVIFDVIMIGLCTFLFITLSSGMFYTYCWTAEVRAGATAAAAQGRRGV